MVVSSPAAELSRRLAENAEAVCRHYLSNGRRCGSYWVVGDVLNTPGRSLYVRLRGPSFGKGAAGKWTDAATGEHGDLLDLIGLNCGFGDLRDAMDEARAFLALPPPPPPRLLPVPRASPQAARRLFAAGRPVAGTPAAAYLRARGITRVDWPSLRFHPCVFYRETDEPPRETWPALLAAVTDLAGHITGVHRTWLDIARHWRAALATPRRSLGHLFGNGVRFGTATDVLVAGEGIETMLSLKSILPAMPMVAGLSANHLAALELPIGLQRLYIARDRDAEGARAATRLRARSGALGIEVIDLRPTYADFNVDLRRLGARLLLRRIVRQLLPEDAARFAGSLIRPCERRAVQAGRGSEGGGVVRWL